MRLSAKRFNRMLSRVGQHLDWRRSETCPCIDPNSGSPEPGCPYCNGHGRRWFAPVASVVGVVSREIVRKYAPMEILDAGDIMLVIPSDQPVYAIGELDRVVMADRTEPFSLTRLRGTSDFIGFAPSQITAVTWIWDGELMSGAIPSVASDGSLSWASGAPPDGVVYALSGRRHPEYFCYLTLPTDRPIHGGEPLPRRVVLRRFDLFGS